MELKEINSLVELFFKKFEQLTSNNFEKKNIAGIESEVLILGSIDKINVVHLISASDDAKNGDHIA